MDTRISYLVPTSLGQYCVPALSPNTENMESPTPPARQYQRMNLPMSHWEPTYPGQYYASTTFQNTQNVPASSLDTARPIPASNQSPQFESQSLLPAKNAPLQTEKTCPTKCTKCTAAD